MYRYATLIVHGHREHWPLTSRSFADWCSYRAWQAVELDADGWRVLNNPPVRFRLLQPASPTSRSPVEPGEGDEPDECGEPDEGEP